jgi:acyl-CoA thioester hydrolase
VPVVFEHPHVVRASEIDGVGHVNNIEYVRWMQDAAIAHSAAQGWPPERHRELGHGWVVRSHGIEYRQPAFASDSIIVRTWVAGMSRVTSLRRYEILRSADAAVLAVAHTNWAYINFATHQPCRIPADVTAAFEVLPNGG